MAQTYAEEFKAKMKAEGLSDAFVGTFMQCYEDLVSGKTGMVPESTLDPVDSIPKYEDLTDAAEPALLGQTVVLKLNGGLGTGMGLEKAKSLLTVKDDNTFLDFICKQIIYFREQHKQNVKFMVMNSFSTSDDTKAFLTKYPDLVADPDFELLQNKAPKVDAESLKPASWTEKPDCEWCPPGHGDLYAALAGSGKLDSLLAKGIKYAFVSNSDNLGATLDTKILAFFSKANAPMLMEVCERTASDKKGGHLARDKADGKLILREAAQCAKEDEDQFQDITRHRFFNTNNLWLNLPLLKQALDRGNGIIPLPMICNSKTVDPRNADSPKVFQLETAMGAAIASLPGSQALLIPRTRFAPVKTCNDLFVLRSDCYRVTDDWRLELVDSCGGKGPVVDLDSKLYKLVDGMETLIPNGVPSLVGCKKLKVSGKVEFAAGTVLEGEVTITNSSGDRKQVEGKVDGTKDL
eukprot:NODE_480_length_1621_cov_247.877226_g364_i0.p1 GENE.NODE_480_length_1621_cov_247.877226_g364_i0~~NODE_480_length_1621_cov_247.877226_g364_i0.p1  ORF type:complete len:464 (+),score=144.59 NODE_480_length_1621_cov_247.877226_g364_i0:84-1475(+)